MHKAKSASKFVTAPACLLTGWLRRPAQQARWLLGYRHSSAAGWSPPAIACKGNDIRKLLAGTCGSQATSGMSAWLLHLLDGASSKLLPAFPHTTHHHHQQQVLQVLPDGHCTAASFLLQWTVKNMEVGGKVRSSGPGLFVLVRHLRL